MLSEGKEVEGWNGRRLLLLPLLFCLQTVTYFCQLMVICCCLIKSQSAIPVWRMTESHHSHIWWACLCVFTISKRGSSRHMCPGSISVLLASTSRAVSQATPQSVCATLSAVCLLTLVTTLIGVVGCCCWLTFLVASVAGWLEQSRGLVAIAAKPGRSPLCSLTHSHAYSIAHLQQIMLCGGGGGGNSVRLVCHCLEKWNGENASLEQQ